jgi:hypothetical protein
LGVIIAYLFVGRTAVSSHERWEIRLSLYRIPTLIYGLMVLRDKFPELCDYRINRRTYMDVVQRCKLYDFANHQWLDFDGKVTARVTLANAAA